MDPRGPGAASNKRISNPANDVIAQAIHNLSADIVGEAERISAASVEDTRRKALDHISELGLDNK